MVKFKRVDWAGAISLILTVFLLLFTLDRGGNLSWNDRLTIYSLAAFPICFIFFAVIKIKFASEPFAPQQIILQAVFGQTASLVGLWLLIGAFGALTGSLGGELIMQTTGKYYRLTIVSHFGWLLGAIAVNLSTGIIVTLTIGIAAGKHFLSLLSIDIITNPILPIGLVINPLGNGENYLLKAK